MKEMKIAKALTSTTISLGTPNLLFFIGPVESRFLHVEASTNFPFLPLLNTSSSAGSAGRRWEGIHVPQRIRSTNELFTLKPR